MLLIDYNLIIVKCSIILRNVPILDCLVPLGVQSTRKILIALGVDMPICKWLALVEERCGVEKLSLSFKDLLLVNFIIPYKRRVVMIKLMGGLASATMCSLRISSRHLYMV